VSNMHLATTTDDDKKAAAPVDTCCLALADPQVSLPI
jgi:hypothetical protein